MTPPISIEDALKEFREMFLEKLIIREVKGYNFESIMTYNFPNNKPFIKVCEQSYQSFVSQYIISIDDYYLKYKADKKHVNHLIKNYTIEIKSMKLIAPTIIAFARLGKNLSPYKFGNEYIAVKQIYDNCVFTRHPSGNEVEGCQFKNCHFAGI